MDKITVRAFKAEADYSDVCSWWEWYPNWSPLPLSHLPPLGFLAETPERKLAAIWLYELTPAFGAVEFLISNPKASGREKVAAIHALLEELKTVAKARGMKHLWTSLTHAALGKMYEQHGFQKSDEGVTHYIAGVN